MSPLTRFTHPLLNALVGHPLRLAFTHTRVVGRRNVPRRGPLIVVSNHLCNVDPVLIDMMCPRPIAFMAKEELFGVPLVGLLARLYGTFPVRRLEADWRALRRAEAILQAGGAVGMFPEGTRSRTWALKRAHPGTAYLALRTGAPFLPVAVAGSEAITSLGQLFRRHRVTVTFGSPFRLAPVERITKSEVEEATRAIMARIAQLLPERYRGVYAAVEGAGSAAAETSVGGTTKEGG